MSLHLTHPAELTPEVTEAFARLADAGHPARLADRSSQGRQRQRRDPEAALPRPAEAARQALLSLPMRSDHRLGPLPHAGREGPRDPDGSARSHDRLCRAGLRDRRAGRRRQGPARAGLAASGATATTSSFATSRASSTPTPIPRAGSLPAAARRPRDADRDHLRPEGRLPGAWVSTRRPWRSSTSFETIEAIEAELAGLGHVTDRIGHIRQLVVRLAARRPLGSRLQHLRGARRPLARGAGAGAARGLRHPLYLRRPARHGGNARQGGGQAHRPRPRAGHRALCRRRQRGRMPSGSICRCRSSPSPWPRGPARGSRRARGSGDRRELVPCVAELHRRLPPARARSRAIFPVASSRWASSAQAPRRGSSARWRSCFWQRPSPAPTPTSTRSTTRTGSAIAWPTMRRRGRRRSWRSPAYTALECARRGPRRSEVGRAGPAAFPRGEPAARAQPAAIRSADPRRHGRHELRRADRRHHRERRSGVRASPGAHGRGGRREPPAGGAAGDHPPQRRRPTARRPTSRTRSSRSRRSAGTCRSWAMPWRRAAWASIFAPLATLARGERCDRRQPRRDHRRQLQAGPYRAGRARGAWHPLYGLRRPRRSPSATTSCA